ncbi:MAG: rod shape-determining protein MreD [Omnitrophica bacterium]|nr:rod shape-determining protein MreD [Candidatus Omnitrophota bacterium]
MRINDRIACYAVIIILFFLEATVFNRFEVLGVRPELLLIATIFFAFNFGPVGGLEVGFASGVLKDTFSTTAFGVNAFSFLLVGLLSGFLKNRLFKENFILQFLTVNAGVYLASGIYFLYLKEALSCEIGIGLWKASAYKGLYTGLAGLGLFFVLGKIFKPKTT